MKIRWLMILAVLGLLAGIGAAVYYGRQSPPLPPVFKAASNPYATGIYANGIIESDQASGTNLNLYAEVSGTVARILVQEGQTVKQGDALIQVEDSVQRALAAQQQSQADAADAQLSALMAQPRKETLDVTRAQVGAAEAGLRTVQDQLDKLEAAARLNPKAVSRDAMDNAANAVRVARGNLDVAQRQYDLTRAGAWIYDVRSLQKQRDALQKGAAAATALLGKYVVRAPADGVVMSVNTSPGAYVSQQGTYDAYTRSYVPLVTMSAGQGKLAVRVYVDEILVHRLPPGKVQARMFFRGTDVSVPLEFVRVQPYISPKVQLSDQRSERVDVRVLPLLFRFAQPANFVVYPGQLVDVYLQGAS
jgi:HlyD family secretion protein